MRRLKSLTRLIPASGGFSGDNVPKVIRFTRMGCGNRPFYHLVVASRYHDQYDQCIEQIGSFDPVPNERNEKVAAINFERLGYWIAQDAKLSKPAAQLIGLSGFLPIHPRTYMMAWRNRRKATEQYEAEKAALAKAAAEKPVEENQPEPPAQS